MLATSSSTKILNLLYFFQRHSCSTKKTIRALPPTPQIILITLILIALFNHPSQHQPQTTPNLP